MQAFLEVALVRISAIPRSPFTSIALAAILLAIPMSANAATYRYGPLSVPEIEILVLVAVAGGWILVDRLVALGIPVVGIALVLLATAAGSYLVSRVHMLDDLGLYRGDWRIISISLTYGGLVRGATDGRRSMASLVVISAVTSWLTYDIPRLPFRPLRDLSLYLDAASKALGGTSPYLTTSTLPVPDPEKLPFVYPPFTLPLFELLAIIPRPLADALWIGGSVIAVVSAFWLLGVRGRWLLVLIAWPATAVGLAVGNVASFTFLLYVLGFRLGAALVLSGIFKVQSIIPGLWLIRERRWRELALGFGIIAILAIISLPVVGLETWFSWPNGVRLFAELAASLPPVQGLSLARSQGPTLTIGITVLAIGFALLRRGRNSLAQFGLASVVGSPTLYLHGLSPLLAGALCLGPEMLWFFLGLGPWSFWFGLQSAWLAMALVGLALLAARGNDLRLPSDLTPSRADVHPAAATGQVWPDPSGQVPICTTPSGNGRSAASRSAAEFRAGH